MMMQENGVEMRNLKGRSAKMGGGGESKDRGIHRWLSWSKRVLMPRTALGCMSDFPSRLAGTADAGKGDKGQQADIQSF